MLSVRDQSCVFQRVSRYFGVLPKTRTTRIVPRFARPYYSESRPQTEKSPTVRGVLYGLHDLGMEFGKISYDSWGSHESIQILQSQGYEAEHLSVDASPQPNATLKDAIYDGRLPKMS